MTFRAAGRLIWFAWEMVVILVNYLFTAAFAPQQTKRLARAAWLSRSSRRHLKIFGYAADVSGGIPKTGVLITNHLSYLDILAICRSHAGGVCIQSGSAALAAVRLARGTGGNGFY